MLTTAVKAGERPVIRTDRTASKARRIDSSDQNKSGVDACRNDGCDTPSSAVAHACAPLSDSRVVALKPHTYVGYESDDGERQPRPIMHNENDLTELDERESTEGELKSAGQPLCRF